MSQHYFKLEPACPEPPEPGTLSTQAPVSCGLCSRVLEWTGGPGHAICIPCVAVLGHPEIREGLRRANGGNGSLLKQLQELQRQVRVLKAQHKAGGLGDAIAMQALFDKLDQVDKFEDGDST